MKFISTVFQIYQRFLIYIGGFQNISAILNLYRRFFKYIDLPTKIDNAKDPLIRKWVLSNHLFSENRRSCVNPGSKFISPLCRTYTVLFPSNFGGFPGLYVSHSSVPSTLYSIYSVAPTTTFYYHQRLHWVPFVQFSNY